MRRFNFCLVLLTSVVVWPGCKTTPRPTSSFSFPEASLRRIEALIEQGIADHRLPGAVWWIEHDGVFQHGAVGKRAIEPVEELMTEDTLFDAASLTKVVATTPAVMLLAERGTLDLEAPVQKYIEEFRRHGKDGITLRHLLTHTSGLRSGLGRRVEGQRTAIAYACQEIVTNAPGTGFIYSDINYILLGEVVQRVSGQPLEQFVAEEIYQPLKMKHTRYLPWKSDLPRVAPTQREGTNMLRGVVHDPTARGMGGVAGHAGVFSTASDLARFARMMLNGGELDGVRLFRPETVSAMTRVQSPATLSVKRGFGWDIDTGFSRRGEIFPLGSYGHTGFTGTALWIDPYSKTFWILLSNRVHPDGKANISSLQKSFSTLVAEAAGLQRASATEVTNSPAVR
jgi:CubicO group peptidase (beta-lactamase class C family)